MLLLPFTEIKNKKMRRPTTEEDDKLQFFVLFLPKDYSWICQYDSSKVYYTSVMDVMHHICPNPAAAFRLGHSRQGLLYKHCHARLLLSLPSKNTNNLKIITHLDYRPLLGEKRSTAFLTPVWHLSVSLSQRCCCCFFWVVLFLLIIHNFFVRYFVMLEVCLRAAWFHFSQTWQSTLPPFHSFSLSFSRSSSPSPFILHSPSLPALAPSVRLSVPVCLSVRERCEEAALLYPPLFPLFPC